MCDLSLFIGDNLHAVLDKCGAASLMCDAIDRNAAFETNAHSAEWATRCTSDGAPKIIDSSRQNSCGDCCAVINGNVFIVNSYGDQCSTNFLAGEYGSIGIAELRPRIASAISSPVPSDVVIPNPSCPAAT